jgi:phosphoenolpyruvate carboxykinase (GTP)
MGDYFSHWLSFQERTEGSKLPKIFHVNWFRKSKQGKFLWPGYGENIRVLEWILKRCEQDAADHSNAEDSSIGLIPTANSINVSGLDISPSQLQELFSIESSEWLSDSKKTREFLTNFGDRISPPLLSQLEQLEQSLEASKAVKTP